MSGSNVSGEVAGDVLCARKEGSDRTGQRCETYALAEALLRHLGGEGNRGEVRVVFSLDDAAWARYRAEVARPYRGEPAVTVVPVPGVGTMEFRRARGGGPVAGPGAPPLTPEARERVEAWLASPTHTPEAEAAKAWTREWLAHHGDAHTQAVAEHQAAFPEGR